MGKSIIFKGVDFSENAIVVNLLMKIKAGESFTYEGVTYSGGTDGAYYELEDVPSSFGSSTAQNYLQEVKIGKPFVELGYQYFFNQKNLEKVQFGSDVYWAGQAYNFFKGCTALTSVTGTPNLSRSTHLSGTFSGCTSLVNIDLSTWNTSTAIILAQFFASCTALKSVDISSFSTASATSVQRMFNGCTSLETLVLGSAFDLNKTIDVTDMFYNCNKLSSIVATHCTASDYATQNTQMYALVSAISGSGFQSARALTPLVITCANNQTLTGTYVHGTGWTWAVS